MIMLFAGYQRSGKTAGAIYFCRKFNEQGLPVYTNMRDVEGFTTIEKIDEVPPNSVLLLDEVPNLMDSRNYKNFTDITIWFNTLRKRNIYLVMTAIRPEMVDLRVRQQLQYIIYSKGTDTTLYYMILDVHTKSYKNFSINKTNKFFNYLRYDTKQIPNIIDMSVKEWIKKNC